MRLESDALSRYLTQPDQLARYLSVKIVDAMLAEVPLLRAALRKMTRLCAGFSWEADNDRLQAAMDDWAATVIVNDLQRGFRPFAYRHVKQVIAYGTGASEFVLSADGREVERLYTLPPDLVSVGAVGGELRVGETLPMGKFVPFPRQDLILFNVFDPDKDQPLGSSLFLPLTGAVEVIGRIQDAIRQTWQRYGSPSFLVSVVLPEGIGTTEEADEISAKLKGEWDAAMIDRRNREGIRDFHWVGQSEITAEPIGVEAIAEANMVAEPWKAMMEQLVAICEFPAYVYGLAWGGDRMTSQAAEMLIAGIEGICQELEPSYMHLGDWVQRTKGVAGALRPSWKKVNLRDLVEQARAELMQQQADKDKIANAVEMWRQGFIDQQAAAIRVDPMLTTVAVKLPAPVAVVPPRPPGPGGGNDGGQGDQGNGNGGGTTGRQMVEAIRREATWGAYP